ncbi:MAG TPA: kynureninase [Chitinophagaceae bacterium]
MNLENSLMFAQNLDEKDELRSFREKFYFPQHEGSNCIYLTGNSLGLQPRITQAYVQQELNDWANMGVEGHFNAKHPWLHYHEMFNPILSKIVGCEPDEVVVMNSLTVNLHLLLVSFYKPTKQRFKIICEQKAFPSDQYALETQVLFHGFDPDSAIIEVKPRAGEQVIRTEDIVDAIGFHKDELALVLFGGVNYYTGQFFDIRSITRAAHDAGVPAGFDLAHAAGNVELSLHDWEVDFACWCSYKYLNSGPGGVAGVYIHEKHAKNKKTPRFGGWWGYDKESRFKMEKGFNPIATTEGWQLSNAPVLSMAAHKAALDIFEEAGMNRIHAKRKLLTAFLHFVINEINVEQEKRMLHVITPAEPDQHGCQISILMESRGKEVFHELTKKGVIADWREPNVIRAAPVPLYNSFEDVWRFGSIIRNIIQ